MWLCCRSMTIGTRIVVTATDDGEVKKPNTIVHDRLGNAEQQLKKGFQATPPHLPSPLAEDSNEPKPPEARSFNSPTPKPKTLNFKRIMENTLVL